MSWLTFFTVIGFLTSFSNSYASIQMTGQYSHGRDQGTDLQGVQEKFFEVKGVFPLEDEKSAVTSWGIALKPTLGIRSLTAPPIFHRNFEPREVGLGLTAAHLSQAKEFYLFGANLRLSGESGKPSDMDFSPTAYGLGTITASSSIRYLYGAAFSFAYGSGLPLPILGVRWKANREWQISFILPILAKAQWKISNANEIQFFSHPAGFHSSVENRNTISGQPDQMGLRLRQFKIGAGIQHKISSLWDLEGEIGSIFRRKATLMNGHDTIIEQNINRSSYIQIGICYSCSRDVDQKDLAQDMEDIL